MNEHENLLHLKETVIPVEEKKEKKDEFEDLSMERLQTKEPEERVLSEASLHGELPPWVRAQIKAFLGWMNSHLAKRNIKISSIQGICDGVSLCHLLEILEKKTIFSPLCKQNTTSMHRHLENVQLVLDYFNENSSKQLIGITGHAIVHDKNLDLILGLIWQFILKYSITMSANIESGGDDDDIIGLNTETVTEALLRWVNEHTPDEVRVTNFTTSFSDGVVFVHLLDGLKPGSVNFEDFEELTEVEALQKSFDVAETDLGIPQLLDADLVNANPDAHSIMTYVTFFRQYMNVANAGRSQLTSELDNCNSVIGELNLELENTKQLLAQCTAELEDEKNLRQEVESDYDQLAEELEGVKAILIEERALREQLEQAGDSRETENVRIETYKQQNENLQNRVLKLEGDLQKIRKDYTLARKRLKAAQLAGLDLRKKIQDMEDNEKQREIELQLKLEEQRSQDELEKERDEQKAHETLVKVLRIKIDKVTDEKREMEKRLKDLDKQLKRSQQQRHEVGMQAQVLNQKFQSIQNAQVADALFRETTEKSTQTDSQKSKRSSTKRSDRKMWTCSKCTHENPESSVDCQMCQSSRKRKQRERRDPSSSDKRKIRKDVAKTESHFVNGLDPVKCWNRVDKELLTKFKQKKNQITWSFIINGRVHRIVLEHSVTSGKRKIMVDGGREYEEKLMFNQVANHNFFLESVPVKVKIEKQGSWFGYDLWLKDEPFAVLRMRALGLA